MRLVLDTTVLVAAIRSDAGASRWLLQAILQRHRDIAMLVTVPLMIEYEAVMTRSEHLKASGLSVTDIGALLDAVAVVARPVRLAFLWRPQLPDANDDMVLEAATNGQADGIVTFNERDFAPVVGRFGLNVFPPGEIVKMVKESR